jgi:drug/metabolite transporter (DMT)-like permease
VTKRGWILFGALGVIWGTPYLLIRISVRDISPPTLVFFRTAAAGILFLPVLVRAHNFGLLVRHWRPLVVYTVIEVAVPWLLLSRAEQRLTSSLSGLLIATVPLIAVVLSWTTRHEGAPGWRRLAGLVLGFGGVAVIVGVDVHRSDVLAFLEVLVVAACYAVGPFVVVIRLAEVPAIATVGASLILTGVGYAPVGLTHLPGQLSPEEITSVVLLIVFCTAIAFLVYFALIAEVGPARATVITYVNPAVAVMLGVLILHEPFSTGLAAGVPLVFLGSFLGTRGSAGLADRGGSGRATTSGAPKGARPAHRRSEACDGPSGPGATRSVGRVLPWSRSRRSPSETRPHCGSGWGSWSTAAPPG